MAPKKQPLVRQLQAAIRKVRFLLSFHRSRWLFSSFLGRRSASMQPRRLISFKTPLAGLVDCMNDDFYEAESSFALSRSTSLATERSMSPMPVLDIARSVSDASSSADDIDQRADDFIASFYKQLQMERQVSLELRYLREKDGLERTRSR